MDNAKIGLVFEKSPKSVIYLILSEGFDLVLIIAKVKEFLYCKGLLRIFPLQICPGV